jgi:hypothetical protein
MDYLYSAKDLICLASTCRLMRKAVAAHRSTIHLRESLNDNLAEGLQSDENQLGSLIVRARRKNAHSHVLPARVEAHLQHVLTSLPGSPHLHRPDVNRPASERP